MKTIYSLSFILIFNVLLSNVLTASPLNPDSVVLSAGYANEAYYSLSGGNVQTSPRSTWDIAFRTSKMSSSILINDGSGVVLYTYPKADTSGWATLDTMGFSTWKPMYNDPTDWENGAFSRNQKGHPDYGWGIYNMVTHNLTGDSLFVIKLRNASLRKLWIVGKQSAANIFTFRYANLDGSNEQNVTLDLNAHMGMEFYGYSLQTGEGVAYQPAKNTWDILFTKYMSVQQNGTPYLVTGVLTNNPVSTKKFHPVPLSYDDFGAGAWDSTRSAIGWDWKVFNMDSLKFFIVDSTVFFIKQTNGDMYKLYFTAFTGSGTGIVRFMKGKAAGAGLPGEASSARTLKVWPNPASDVVYVALPDRQVAGLSIFLTDLSGRQLRADHPEGMADGQHVYPFDVSGVQPGNYLVTLSTAAGKYVAKVIINR